MRVDVTVQADVKFGLIEQRHTRDYARLAEVRAAWLRLLTELRVGRPYIWLMPSDRYPDSFTLQDPPLIVHFREITPSHVCIVDVEEIETEGAT